MAMCGAALLKWGQLGRSAAPAYRQQRQPPARARPGGSRHLRGAANKLPVYGCVIWHGLWNQPHPNPLPTLHLRLQGKMGAAVDML